MDYDSSMQSGPAGREKAGAESKSKQDGTNCISGLKEKTIEGEKSVAKIELSFFPEVVARANDSPGPQFSLRSSPYAANPIVWTKKG